MSGIDHSTTSIPTDTRIKDYLNGHMSGDEAESFEIAMLEDKNLADAVALETSIREGFSENKQTLIPKEAEESWTAVFDWKLAAALLSGIVIGGGIVSSTLPPLQDPVDPTSNRFSDPPFGVIPLENEIELMALRSTVPSKELHQIPAQSEVLMRIDNQLLGGAEAAMLSIKIPENEDLTTAITANDQFFSFVIPPLDPGVYEATIASGSKEHTFELEAGNGTPR